MKTTHIVFIAAMALTAILIASCAGLDLGDLVRVKTPNAIQQTTGLPASTSLNEAETEYQGWFENTQRTGAQWKANIERAGEVRGLLSQLTLQSLDAVGPTLAGVPVLAPALPALTGLVGLFLGTGRLRKEKEASFNKGLDKGRTLPGGGSAPGSSGSGSGV